VGHGFMNDWLQLFKTRKHDDGHRN
jgi:hypothetical protein